LATNWLILLRNPGTWHIKVFSVYKSDLSLGFRQIFFLQLPELNLTIFLGSLTLFSGYMA
jgi:hypothetical protein